MTQDNASQDPEPGLIKCQGLRVAPPCAQPVNVLFDPIHESHAIMSKNDTQGRGTQYGTAAGEEGIDLAGSQESRGVMDKRPQEILNNLKEALRPHDARRTGDTTHDGRHGGAAENMIPGHRDYNETGTQSDRHRNASDTPGMFDHILPGHQEHRSSDSGGSLFEAMKPSGKLRGSDGPDNSDTGVLDKMLRPFTGNQTSEDKHRQTKDTGVGFRSAENYTYDNMGNAADPDTVVGRDRDAIPRKSPFDSQGSVGRQFTTGGAIGSTANKVGGPFAKDGMIGHQFTEKGAVGGTVQDALGGNNDATKTGR